MLNKAKRRVAVTGLGFVTPLGCDVEQVWKKLCAGESGVGELTRIDKSRFDRVLAAEVKGFEDLPEASDEELKPHGRATGYALACARMALEDAFGEWSPKEPTDVGLVVGTTMGSMDVVERINDEFGLNGETAVPAAALSQYEYCKTNSLTSVVTRRLGLEGPTMVFPTACAAGNYAVASAAQMIENGDADVVVAGGADPFSRTCYTIFYRLGGSTGDRCRPFSRERDGMVVGEGGAMLVLEDMDRALARGATIYAEVTGYGLACDAHHRTSPHPEGEGAVTAMKNALGKAGLAREAVGFLCAHGTGTPANDVSEAKGMATVFGEGLSQTPVSSIKSMIGHCMGAASAIEAVICCLAIRDGHIPPTINTTECDDRFDPPLDVVVGEKRDAELAHVMSNAFAFGGCTSSLIVSKVEEKLG